MTKGERERAIWTIEVLSSYTKEYARSVDSGFREIIDTWLSEAERATRSLKAGQEWSLGKLS